MVRLAFDDSKSWYLPQRLSFRKLLRSNRGVKVIRVRQLVFLCFSLFSIACPAKTWPDPRPKLIVVMVIDQFRADYIMRNRNQLSSHGFKALIENGSYFPFAEYDIMQSM